MQVGDLVEHEKFGIGIVTEISEPTPLFAYQIASVNFNNGQLEQLVTTVLHQIKKEKN